MTLPHLDGSGRPTLRTVAALAGVHVSTASRALTQTPPAGARAASKDTIARIQRVATEIGFERNPHGAGLRTSRSHLVGVLVPRLTDVVLSTIYEGIDERARELGYQAFVVNGRDVADQRWAALEMLLARRVDGLIIGDARLADDDLVDSLVARHVPFVLTNRHAGDHPAVTCDDYAGGVLAAEHLLELGHTDVAVLAGQPYASTGHERSAGFAATYAAAGHPVPGHRILHSAFDVAGGRVATTALLAQHGPPPSAVFVVNDFAAIGAIGAAAAHGLRVGDNIAIVGYNDIPIAAELPVPLTSVASPMHDMGARSIELLLQVLAGETVAPERLAPTLSARESTTASSVTAHRAPQIQPRPAN
ncbi:LacI family transcriptional regulator [Actinomycetospora endophytica]|uniref:LacI family transcriptional regulator n=1 Tax=Actinomycetospora endophytica TaxID=2291215 RepID=A0ABS8P891_9PSEU|nr:LacI family DNA-binding transcriptional regulator [Actinomycetospora endophytica]MCD2193616.1 LacI family transcriptional regulator [Actinomycetospora endophytica]